MRAHRFNLTFAARKVAVQAASRSSAPAFRDGMKRTTDSDGGTVADWIAEISQVWSRGTGHALELARVIGKARNRLRHGEWTQVVKSLPFSKKKADMLATIGKRLAWVNEQTSAHLPIGWNILYQLALLERAVFEKLLNEEAIHPKLTLGEAKELVARFNGRRRKKQSGITIMRRLRQLRDYVARTLSQWKPNHHELAKQALTDLLAQIDAPGTATRAPASRHTLAVTLVHQTQGRL